MKIELKSRNGFAGIHYYMIVEDDYYNLNPDIFTETNEKEALDQAAIILGQLFAKGEIKFEWDGTV